jgi:hypothetical protein
VTILSCSRPHPRPRISSFLPLFFAHPLIPFFFQHVVELVSRLCASFPAFQELLHTFRTVASRTRKRDAASRFELLSRCDCVRSPPRPGVFPLRCSSPLSSAAAAKWQAGRTESPSHTLKDSLQAVRLGSTCSTLTCPCRDTSLIMRCFQPVSTPRMHPANPYMPQPTCSPSPNQPTSALPAPINLLLKPA